MIIIFDRYEDENVLKATNWAVGNQESIRRFSMAMCLPAILLPEPNPT